MDLVKKIRKIKDFPKEGILFRDITTLLKDKKAFKLAVDSIVKKYKNKKIDKVVSIEARGFIIGAVIAYKLNAGFVPIRKKGKLPAEVEQVTYELEYGSDTVEMHKDAIKKGDKVLLFDDLLATGGTMHAAAKLVEKLGGKVVGIAFLIELQELKGREKLTPYDVFSLIFD